MNAFLRKFSDPIRLTFAAVPKGKAPYQTAMGYNLRNAFTGEYPNQGKILLSKGSIQLPLNASLSLHPKGFVIQWEYDFDKSGSTVGDHLVVIVLYKDEPACSFRFTDTRRYEKQCLWKTKQVISPDALPDVWIAFQNGITSVHIQESIVMKKHQCKPERIVYIWHWINS